MNAYLRTKALRADGTADSYHSRAVQVKVKPLWWHEQNHSRTGPACAFTASGYGPRIPTRYMVQVDGKWRRVYCCIYSNSGTLFIGKKYDGSAIVDIDID